MPITYAREENLSVEEFIDALKCSTLAERRPVSEPARIARMLKHANLIITARENGLLVGVVRALTDFSYCCYLSDLAVDKAFQKRGIGQQLIEEVRKAAGPESICLLTSAPKSMSFYESIGMPKADNAFIYKRER